MGKKNKNIEISYNSDYVNHVGQWQRLTYPNWKKVILSLASKTASDSLDPKVYAFDSLRLHDAECPDCERYPIIVYPTIAKENIPEYKSFDTRSEENQKINDRRYSKLEKKEPEKPSLNVGFFALCISGCFAGIGLVSIDVGTEFLGVFILVLSLFGLILGLVSTSASTSTYEKEKNEYESEMQIALSDCIYNNNLLVYNGPCIEECVLNRIHSTGKGAMLFKSVVTRYYLNQAAKPSRINRSGKVGYAESFFYNFLKNKQDGFRNDLALITYSYQSGLTYEPDIVFCGSEPFCLIDIEIDEPYNFVSEKVTHTDNALRDDFFVSNGWVVIRFAEEQILLAPEECYSYIVGVYSSLFKVPKVTETSDWPLFPKITLETKKWDKRDAEKLIQLQAREAWKSNKTYQDMLS